MIEPESAAFPGPSATPEGERYHSGGASQRQGLRPFITASIFGRVEYSQEPYSGVPAAQDTGLQFYGASSAVRAIRIKSALAVGDNFTA